MKKVARRVNFCELIRALLDGPKSRKELHDFTELSRDSLRVWLRELHASGVAYIATRRGHEAVWALQPKPFAMQDAPLLFPRRAARRQPLECSR